MRFISVRQLKAIRRTRTSITKVPAAWEIALLQVP
jgi:hypothetical protein